jgi:glycosyltransferase involved in cell wall biosynthesis
VILGSVKDRTMDNLAYVGRLRDLVDRTPGAQLRTDYLDDEAFDRWIAAADRVVLPYRRSWSSGILARARRLGTPAIVSAVGGLPEQAGPDDEVFTTDEDLVDLMAGDREAAVR